MTLGNLRNVSEDFSSLSNADEAFQGLSEDQMS